MSALPKDNVLQFKDGAKMSPDKFVKGFVMSSQLYRKEVYPFLSDAGRHVYFELENRLNGFQKSSDYVSYSQLQGNSELEGARVVARATVAKGIKELVDHGVITILATHRKLGNKYQINEVSLLGKQYTKKTSTASELVHVVDRTSTRSRPQVVHVVDTQKKDLNISIKNIHTHSEPPKNSVDDVLNLWTPDLHSLNSWLQRAGEKALTQDEVNTILLEVNAHYESHIRSDAVSDSKMYSNFVKWVKSDFAKYRKSGNQSSARPKSALQQTADQWAEERFAEQQKASSIIDVNQDQVLIGGEREYF